MKKIISIIVIAVILPSTAFAISAQEAAAKCTKQLKESAATNISGISDSKLKEKASQDFDRCMAGYGFKR
jgi:hypothetical protein